MSARLQVIGGAIVFLALAILLTPRAPDNELHSRVSKAGTWHHFPGFSEYDKTTKENPIIADGEPKKPINSSETIERMEND